LLVWFVANKTDLLSADDLAEAGSRFRTIVPEASIFVSAATGAGLDALVERIGKFAETALQGEPALVTRERHRQMMGLASASLAGALAMDQQFGTEGREELIAEQLRAATHALERLTGRVDVEDILDVIFRDFCIGK
jgi:tRNA modification GTPase